VVICYRTEEIGRRHPLRTARARLRRGGFAREVDVPPLPDPDVRALIHQLEPGVEPALAADVVARADGIPFYAEQLVAGHGAGVAVPESLRDAVAMRLERLDAAARVVLETASMLESPFDVDLAETLAEVRAIDRLIDDGLIVSDPAGARFRHEVVRDAVCAGISPGRRRALHLRAAHALDAAGAAPAQVARHAVAGNDRVLARRALLAEADEHVRTNAHRDAVRCLRAALQGWNDGAGDAARTPVVDRLAACLEQIGEHSEALALLHELARRHHDAGDDAARAEVLQRTAAAAEALGEWGAALAAREEAATLLGALGRFGPAALERLAEAVHLRSAGCFSAALPVLAAARVDATAAGDPGLVARVEALHGNVMSRAGHPGGVAHVTRALDLALSHGLSAPAAEAYQRLADSLEHTGDYIGAQQAYAAAVDFCDTHGHDATRQLCRACAGYVLFQRGDWDRACAVDRDVLDDPVSSGHAQAAAGGVLGLVFALRGRTGKARTILLSAFSTANRLDLVGPQLLASWGLAVLGDLDGSPESAAMSGRRLLTLGVTTEDCHYSIPALQWAAAMFAARGRLAEVRLAAVRLAALAETTGTAEVLAARSHAQAEVAVLEGDLASAASSFRRALAFSDEAGVAYPAALLRTRAALVLRDASGPEEAVRTLREARPTAHRLRVAPLLREIDERLFTLGEQPSVRRRRDETDGRPDAGTLTEREHEVMTLVAAGHTSRRIAGRLFLSVRTVDMHVRNSMIKLNCRTRAQAVARFTGTEG
jgi:DNA-binding NarL/FixJ family response regulator